ncbi:unnamed protein product [Effrenium voratum]|nr:unnamed protein product [Effrenium voratum]
MLWHLILVALLSVDFARALCRWPVPLPSGYLINCNTAEPLALEEVPNCTVSCEGPWHFGAANLSCSDGGLQLSGCLVPSAAQSGALVNLGTAPGSRLGGLAVDIWRGRLVATDEAQHVVLALGMDGSVEVIWGQLGVRGDADGVRFEEGSGSIDPSIRGGTASNGALLAEPLGLVQTQTLLFVADTGNGKARLGRGMWVLALDTGVTVTAASGFSEPKGLALGSSELLVADSGAVLRLPLASALDAGTWSSAAVQASSLSSVSGVTGQPSWLGFRDSTGELFVSESSGSVQRLLNGARTELLQSGPFDLSDALPRSSGFLPAPGPLAVDETVETSMLLVADSQALFGLELRTSDRSCSDLGWDSSHGNIAVCGRSAGSDVLGARCNYTFVDGVCCSGALNFTDAERFCTLQGARLCTQEELFDDEARDDPFSPHCLTGASVAYDGPYDQANVWSSTACFVEGTGAVGFMTRAGSRRWRNWAVDRCQTAEETAVVKCCADRGFLVPMAGLGGLDTSHGLFQDFESNITAIAMDSARRLAFLGLEDKVYIADRNNHRVRVLDRSTGILVREGGKAGASDFREKWFPPQVEAEIPTLLPTRLEITSAAGPVLFSTSGSSVQAEYSAYPDPNMTSAHLPKDLVTTTPVGLVVSSDASFAVISDEHSESLLHLDRSVVPRRVRVIQGTSAIRNPKDLLLAENGTLFVADHSSQLDRLTHVVCDADADFYTGGCRVLAPPRRILGVSYVPGTPVVPGDGDSERRSFLAGITSSASRERTAMPPAPAMRSEHQAARRKTPEGTCDSDVAGGFDFEAFQRSVVDSERVTCVRDSRSWWSDAMPGFESNRESRITGGNWAGISKRPRCTYNMPAEIPCDGVFMEHLGDDELERLYGEDDSDFSSDVYTLAESSTDQLLSSWKVFTALKDDSLQGRRLENAAWRLHAMQKLGKSVTQEAASRVTGGKYARNLAPIAEQVLQVLHDHSFSADDLPTTAEDLRWENAGRPACAIFTHSLERTNGANNFCLYIARILKTSQPLTIFSPKAGPMKDDFEKLGLEVTIVDTTSPTFLDDLSKALLARHVGILLANTIMRCDIILMAVELKMPSVWVIHESWPQDQLDHYAKEVFMCKDIDSTIIRKAFASAGTIVFPSDMQRRQYDGMFKPEAGLTIYNGIPLQHLDHFKQTQDRSQVRSSLGYTDQDFLVLHLGTVCSRKGQMYSATACAQLIHEDDKCTNLKQLIVGARYIRDHEIKYIDQIFKVAAQNDVSCERWEERKGATPQITVMDIQAEVMRFYMAADVVVVPSLNEVLPLVICEAMAFEKPVVCSRIDAIPEALDDGVEGFLVPPADPKAIRASILKLYNDPSLRKQMGVAGRQRVLRQFSYSAMGQSYRDLLDKVDLQPKSAMSFGLKGRTVLVDMDNTIVDWDGEFIRRYAQLAKKDPTEVEKSVRSRASFEIEENFSKEEAALVLEAVASPGLYESLEPLPGAVEALQAMVQEGVDVKLVTAPHPTCAGTCALEKYLSVERLLGKDFTERLIITRDKTTVQGDLLIDDKPKITGSKPQSWKHVVFSQSYNQHVKTTNRLSSWTTWRETLPLAL